MVDFGRQMDAAAINWTPLVIDGGGRTCTSQAPSADNENQVSDYGVNQMSYGWLAGSGRLRCLFASVADISFVADYFVQ